MEKSVAENLEIDERLLPYLPELWADLWALGSFPDLIVEMLKPLGLPGAETSVLDLGCGKGAVSVTLAKELGFNVVGVDGFRPFLDEAMTLPTYVNSGWRI
ncbi:SAM-dependent methyltransferase [Candidatus Neomarinimicrobiota bacterium]